MNAKRVIQCYKPPGQWTLSPPGVGDFIRGGCHLFEMLQSQGVEVRFDVSATDFAPLIEQDPAVFHAGTSERIAGAAEFFDEHQYPELRERLRSFVRSNDSELYICTNIGAWNRTSLPPETRRFAAGFYRFVDSVESEARAVGVPGYDVLSVRCGDELFEAPDALPPQDVRDTVARLVRAHVLPHAQRPIVVTTDAHAFKQELSKQFGMLALPHRSQHGAWGGARAVAVDLSLLRDARAIYHINTWSDWWSGFSHYTAMTFQIPSVNFRSPRYWKEEITASGELRRERWWHAFVRP